MPVGYRFHPTDEEIISHYLKSRINSHVLVDTVVAYIDLCHSEPWELPRLSKIQGDDEQVWYFFYQLDYKYVNSKRANRTTRTGFWKVTGQPRPIKGRGAEEGVVVGSKRTLVFYCKVPNSKPEKTDWIIHEYQSKTLPLLGQREWVFCKLKNKSNDQTEYSPPMRTSPQVVAPRDLGPDVHHDGVDMNHDASYLKPHMLIDHQEGISLEELWMNDFYIQPDEEDMYPEDWANSILDIPDDPEQDMMYPGEISDENARQYRHVTNPQLQALTETLPSSSLVLDENNKTDRPWNDEPMIMCLTSVREGFHRMEKPKEPEKPKVPKLLQRMVAASKVKLEPKSKEQQKSPSKDRIGRFVVLETIPTSHGRTTPPFIYLVNALVGLVLFAIIIREMLVVH